MGLHSCRRISWSSFIVYPSLHLGRYSSYLSCLSGVDAPPAFKAQNRWKRPCSANIVYFGSEFCCVWSLFVLPFGRAVGYGGISFVESSFVFPNVLNLQKGLETMVQAWVGGLYANPLLVFLAIAGMLSIAAFATRFSRLMLLWIIVPSLALLVVSAENYMFYRIVYLLPFQILAASGVFWLLNNFENAMRLKSSKIAWLLKMVVLVLIVLLFANYALRSVDGAPLHMLS